MIILDPYWRIKKVAKFLGVFLLVAGLLTLAIISYQKTKTKTAKESKNAPLSAPKTNEEKQKAMLDAINKASQEGAKENSATPNGEQDKKQQEMQDAINKTNSQTQPISQEESTRRAQDMLNEMNKANKK